MDVGQIMEEKGYLLEDPMLLAGMPMNILVQIHSIYMDLPNYRDLNFQYFIFDQKLEGCEVIS